MKFEIFAISFFPNFWQIKKSQNILTRKIQLFFFQKGGRHLHLCQSINSVSKNSVINPNLSWTFLIKEIKQSSRIKYSSFFWQLFCLVSLLFVQKSDIQFQLKTLFHFFLKKKSRQFRCWVCDSSFVSKGQSLAA